MTWYKDGRELRSNDHVTLQYSHGVCSLEVMSAKPEDTGVYKCYAVNELGEHETSSKVVVEGTGCLSYHYKNLPMQYTEIFFSCKN